MFAHIVVASIYFDDVHNIYYINQNNFSYGDCNMNNRIEIAREFANAIKSDKIIKIILFGSVAREEDTEDSNIDILIISNEWE